MYTPETFKIDDRATIVSFIKRHSFATIITHDGSIPHATHMPVLLDESAGTQGVLYSHIARANPQWRHFENGEDVLVMFQGPHAYVSPAWYGNHPSVPTWNYTAVHVYGRPRVISDSDRFAKMLEDLVEHYESSRVDRWDGKIPVEYRDQMMKAIVGLEIELTRVEAKYKLSQNRVDDAPRVMAALSKSDHPLDRDVSEMMSQWMAARESR
jgi:transcriptional regulator